MPPYVPTQASAPAVPELAVAVLGAAPLAHAAAPTIAFSLELAAAGGAAVRSVLLDVQLQIAARRRPYEDAEQAALYELFGAPGDWGTTLRTVLWARTTLVVPPFSDRTVVDLLVACTYDLEVSASRYLDALAGGSVPLELLFSGTIFYAGAGGALQAARIPWDLEAEYRLPVAVWRAAVERRFPGTAWLRLGREAFDALKSYRSQHGVASWDATVAALLERAREE
jgi:Family of unknown function (DUF6084)